MEAALHASDETVTFLLSKGASPHLMDSNNMTALKFAILSRCSSTIDLLAPVTTKGVDKALSSLAAFNTELTPAVEDLLRRAASDVDVLLMGVVYARVAKCQIVFTDQIFQTKFYPKKSAQIATNLMQRLNKI